MTYQFKILLLVILLACIPSVLSEEVFISQTNADGTMWTGVLGQTFLSPNHSILVTNISLNSTIVSNYTSVCIYTIPVATTLLGCSDEINTTVGWNAYLFNTSVTLDISTTYYFEVTSSIIAGNPMQLSINELLVPLYGDGILYFGVARTPSPSYDLAFILSGDDYHPDLTYPLNGSTINATYPPHTASINFTWNDTEYPADELLVSIDEDFNLLYVDIFTSNDYYTASLDVDQKYYWKIKQYNSTTETYGETTAVDNFTITSTGGATGQGIQGVVYEIIGGIDTPIDQTTVYIYNTTWSSLSVTGTNGYYLFSGLSNGTYNLYAIKNGYDTTAVFPATVNGSMVTNDILMKIYISPYVPNFVFERFIVRDLFDRSYVGVTVNVYKGGALTTSFTGTTDSTGAVVFQLIKDQRYRVTFTGGGISGTITIYVYAKEETYFVRVITGFPTGGDRYTDISTNLTSVSINATHSNLTLIYNDTRASTSLVQFYATNLTTGTTCYTTSTSSVVTLRCTVVASGTYQFGFNSTSSIYGFFQEDKIINFDVGKPSTPAVETNVDSDLLQWASIILIVLTAALFSIRTVKYGAVIVPLEALALWAFGWFEPVANNVAGSFLLLSCAVVIGVMIYLRSSEVKVNF